MKKYLAIAAMSLLATCGAPAYAQTCFPVEEATEDMAGNGFEITFGDVAGNAPIFMVEDGNGRWIIFTVIDSQICPIMGGNFGVHVPPEPNA